MHLVIVIKQLIMQTKARQLLSDSIHLFIPMDLWFLPSNDDLIILLVVVLWLAPGIKVTRASKSASGKGGRIGRGEAALGEGSSPVTVYIC
jgi:hypothetical protein